MSENTLICFFFLFFFAKISVSSRHFDIAFENSIQLNKMQFKKKKYFQFFSYIEAEQKYPTQDCGIDGSGVSTENVKKLRNANLTSEKH